MREEEPGRRARSLVVGTPPGRERLGRGAGPGRATLASGRRAGLGRAARYEVVRSLGRGGMAEVLLARRVEDGGVAQEVALKCVAPEFDPGGPVQRMFLHEARLASLLHHPGIAEAYGLDEIDGQPYLVLEYVDGVSVGQAIRAAAERGETLPEGFSCRVAACVAEALGYAHALLGPEGRPLGIVHRDVSAQNVMLTRAGDPKLLDFGIARARTEGRERTATGQIRGTYAYLSPEQAEVRQLDGRSDLFSLGLLLVEMLTGRRVFAGDDELLTARAIAVCDPARVEEATRELPGALQGICRRTLARDPADRFRDGQELAGALRHHLRERHGDYGAAQCAAELSRLGLPEASPSPEEAGPTVPMRRPGRARRWAVGAAAGLGVLASAGLAGPRWAHRSAGPTPGTAQPTSGAPAPIPAVAPDPAPGLPPTPAPEAPRAAPHEGPGGAPAVRRRAQEKGAPPAQRAPPTEGKAMAAPPDPGDGVEQAAPEEAVPPPPARSAPVRFADRAVVADAAGTLPRGTLLQVALSAGLDADRAVEAEAVVREDLMSEEAVLVPRGTLVSCRVSGVTNGRLGLSCDGARAGARTWSFSGIALGRDNRSGLVVVDGALPSGTPFLVAVTASALLE